MLGDTRAGRFHAEAAVSPNLSSSALSPLALLAHASFPFRWKSYVEAIHDVRDSSLLRRCFTSLPRRTNLGFRHATKVRTMGAVGEPVQLYIYDLSNGLAAMWGRSLTGQDVEGIWCVLSHFLTDPVGRLSYGSAERFRSAGIRPSSCMAWRSFSDKAYRSSRRRARLTLVPFPSLIQRRRCV